MRTIVLPKNRNLGHIKKKRVSEQVDVIEDRQEYINYTRMGNTPLTIAVKVDSGNNGSVIVAGSILYGRIYLDNQEPVDARSIRLKMIGTEEVVVHHTKHHTNRNGHCHGNHNHTCGHSKRASHTFYNIDHSIKDFPDGIIPRGQYEFPFALQLPKSLPSTMNVQR